MMSDLLLDKLFDYCYSNNWGGYDPFDGLNSKLLKSTPLYNIPFVRLWWTQFFKKCPINFRKAALVPKGFNVKSGALFLMGNCKAFNVAKVERYKKSSYELVDLVKKQAIHCDGGYAWGYNFPWQAKAFYVPVGVPNIVTSVYVGNALLDFCETFGDDESMCFVDKTKAFILNDMIMWEKEETLCFSYIPGKKAEVHNANLLAAAFLSRVNCEDKDERLSDVINKAVRFSAGDVNVDGYWPYGTMSHHRWMDNFHTAYNLESLLLIRRYTGISEYDKLIKKVFCYYVKNMFLTDGTPKYYNNRIYPIDCHVIAEALILFSYIRKNKIDLFDDNEKQKVSSLVQSLVDLAAKKFQDETGYFYYQRHKHHVNKIPYMRWSQAWIFYALACLMTGGNDATR